MPFFHFSQNNSGGSFHRTELLTTDVIVEANTPEEANDRAQQLGIYFNGCHLGRDCSCCGDRWYEQYSYEEGSPYPAIYSRPVEEAISEGAIGSWYRWDAFVFFLDNTFIKFTRDEEPQTFLFNGATLEEYQPPEPEVTSYTQEELEELDILSPDEL